MRPAPRLPSSFSDTSRPNIPPDEIEWIHLICVLLMYILNWCNLKQIELRQRQRELVEGGTGGGEGAGGVGQDPVHLLSHPARLNVTFILQLFGWFLVHVTVPCEDTMDRHICVSHLESQRTWHRHRGSLRRHIHVPSWQLQSGKVAVWILSVGDIKWF